MWCGFYRFWVMRVKWNANSSRFDAVFVALSFLSIFYHFNSLWSMRSIKSGQSKRIGEKKVIEAFSRKSRKRKLFRHRPTAIVLNCAFIDRCEMCHIPPLRRRHIISISKKIIVPSTNTAKKNPFTYHFNIHLWQLIRQSKPSNVLHAEQRT